jgi:hypothetical protein
VNQGEEQQKSSGPGLSERAFRLDFVVAIAALLISALTAATLIYQTHVIGDQFAATIWPYLSLNSTYGVKGLNIQLVNDGLGPALIQSAQLSVDGRAVPTWNDFLQEFVDEPAVREMVLRASAKGSAPPIEMSTASIGPSTTLRPGDARMLIAVSYAHPLPISVLTEKQLSLEICYCSLNGNCWLLHGTPGKDTRSTPQTVSRCSGTGVIGSTNMDIRVHK